MKLALIDMKTRRLPDRYVVCLTGSVMGIILVLAMGQAGPGVIARAFVGGPSLALFYGLIRLVSNGGVGMGDVKLAFPLGALTSALSWSTFVAGFIATSLTGGILALLVIARRMPSKTIPYGPAMIFGTSLACLIRL